MLIYMDYINSVLSQLDENATVSATVGLFLVLYAGMAAPKLPKNIAILFDNYAFKMTIMFLIAYMSSKNSSIAIVATVALVVSLQTLSMYQTNDIILDAIKDKDMLVISQDSEVSEVSEVSEDSEVLAEMAVENSDVEQYYNIEQNSEIEEEGESDVQVSETVESTEEDVVMEESEEYRSKANKLTNVTGYSGDSMATF